MSAYIFLAHTIFVGIVQFDICLCRLESSCHFMPAIYCREGCCRYFIAISLLVLVDGLNFWLPIFKNNECRHSMLYAGRFNSFSTEGRI